MKQKTTKTASLILIVVIISIAFSSLTFADDVISVEGGGIYDDSDVIVDANKKPGPVETFIIEFILSIPKSIMNWLALDDITELVFMRPTAKAKDPVIFENKLNDLSTYLSMAVGGPIGGLFYNPTFKLSTVLETMEIDTKVVFGKESSQVTKVIQDQIINKNTGFSSRRGSFTSFLHQYVDSSFPEHAYYPRSWDEILLKEGIIIEFDEEQWFQYKNEIYTLRAAYIPASTFMTKNLNASGSVMVTTYGKVTGSGTVATNGVYNSYLYGLFPTEFFNIVEGLRQRLESISLYIIMVLIILYGGFRLLIKSSNSESLSYAKELFKGMFMAALLMRFYYYIFEYVAKGNLILVDMFYGLMTNTDKKISFLDMLYNPSTANVAMTIVTFLAVFMTATMNFQYMVRMLTIGVLYAFTPVVAVLSILPERRSAVRTWFNELVGNILTQAIHAGALVFVIKTINVFATSPNLKSKTFWVAMAGMMGLNGLAILIRSLMGLEEFKYNSALGLSANMLGLAPLLGLGRMMTRSFSKKKGSNNSPTSTVSGSQAPSSSASASSPTRSTASPSGATPGAAFNASAAYRAGTAYGAGSTSTKTANISDTADISNTVTPNTNYELTEDGLAYKGETFLQKTLHSAPAGILKTAGAVGLGLTGGLIMAGAGQNPMGGIMIGSSMGAGLGRRMGEGISDKAEMTLDIASRADKEGISFSKAAKEYFGYHDTAQKYNAAYMGTVGRQLFGGPGEIGMRIVTSTRRATRELGNKKADVNTYANDKNIEFMDGLRTEIQESKNYIGIEKVKYDNLKVNLSLMEKKMGNGIYTDEYKNLEALSKNPNIPNTERQKYKLELENMADEQKYVPEYYTEKTKISEQETRYAEAQARHSSAVMKEMEARNKEETLRRLEEFRNQRRSILENQNSGN